MRINRALLVKQLSYWQGVYFDWYALYGEFTDWEIREVIFSKLLRAFSYCMLVHKVLGEPEVYLSKFCYFKGVVDVSSAK